MTNPAAAPPHNWMPPKRVRVAVAMSGGVDSSVAAVLMAQAGHDVVGFTAWTLNGPGKCCNDALINAGRVCETLGIPYDTVDLRAEFSHYVMDYFNRSYQAGLTPNPCVECNRYIKWERLIDYACNTLKADFMVTGHYACLARDPNHPLDLTALQLLPATDTRKDQSYMMARVRPEDLSKTLFPLAHWTKADTYAFAQAQGLPTAHSKESQDVCFILNGQANYLSQALGEKPGDIIDQQTGAVVGQHRGHFHYTVGQRKGVQVAMGYPAYVVGINAANNQITIGPAEALQTTTFTVTDVSWLHPPTANTFTALVKTRYNSPSQLATISASITPGDQHHWHVTLSGSVNGVSAGQIAAFYCPLTQALWGGGYIETHLEQSDFDPNTAPPPPVLSTCGLVTTS